MEKKKGFKKKGTKMNICMWRFIDIITRRCVDDW